MGVIHVSDPDWHLIPNMLNWFHVWTPSWPVHDLNILMVKICWRVTCCMGRGIVLDVHKVTSKQPRRPWQHLIPQDLDVPMPVHGPIHHDQLTPPLMVDGTTYHDWRAMVSIIRLDAGINQPLPLPMAHPALTVFNSSPPSAAHMRQWIRTALVQIMACRLFDAKTLSKPMFGYCQLDS